MGGIGITTPVLAHSSTRRIEIIWADKAAAYVAVGWLAMLFVGWLLAIVACGLAGANLLAEDTAVLALEVGLAIVLSAWIAFTGLDRLFHGPARRVARNGSS